MSKTLHIIAAFLVVIVVMLPINTSVVFATSLEVTDVGGGQSPRVNNGGAAGKWIGYRTERDRNVVHVAVSITGDSDVTPIQVQRRDRHDIFAPYTSFTNCVASGSVFDCWYESTQFTTADTFFEYDVTLFEDDGSTPVPGNFHVFPLLIVDDTAPTILEFSMEPELTTGADITVKYKVEDTSRESGFCSGIESILIKEDDLGGTPVITPTITDPTVCLIEDEVQYSIPSGVEGEYELCIQTTDRLGNTQTTSAQLVCDTVTIDSTAPVISSTASLTRLDGSELGVVGFGEMQTGIPVRFSVNITGDDIDFTTVEANLDALFEGSTVGFVPKSGSCIQRPNDLHTCRWDKTLKITSTTTPTVTVKVSDLAGNADERTITLQEIKYDGIGPEVTSITTSIGLIGNTIFAGSTTDFITTVTEDSLENNMTFLDLTSIGAGIVQADGCERLTQTSYQCGFRGYTIATSGKFEISSVPDQDTDDVGNNADATGILPFKVNITVDAEAPSIADPRDEEELALEAFGVDSFNLTVIPAFLGPQGISIFGTLIVKGDSLHVQVMVRENTTLRAIADFSSAIQGFDRSIITCIIPNTTQPEMKLCEWQTPPIDISGPKAANFTFNFTDAVGNNLLVTRWINLTFLANDTNPNFWEHRVRCTPKLIDRQITTHTNHKMYCRVDLNDLQTGTPARTKFMAVGPCKNPNGSTVDSLSRLVFDTPELSNAREGSISPYLKLTFDTVQITENVFEVTCPLSIFTFLDIGPGGRVTQFPEIENVTLSTRFYNNPLGTYSQEHKNAILDVLDNPIVKLDFINDLKEILSYLDAICGILRTLSKVTQTVASIAAILQAFPATKAAGDSVMTVADTLDGIIGSPNNPSATLSLLWTICAYIWCDKTALELFSDEYGSYSNVQQLYSIEVGGRTTPGQAARPGTANAARATTATDATRTRGRSTGGLRPYESLTGPSGGIQLLGWPSNPRQSLLLSIGTLCLPGIIDGLQRYRQIQCNYGNCLIQSQNSNRPRKICTDQRQYMECTFLMGEIFQILGFAPIQNLLRQITSILSDPYALVFTVAELACRQIPSQASPAKGLCIIPKVIDLLGRIAELVEDFEGLGDAFDISDVDACSQLETDSADIQTAAAAAAAAAPPAAAGPPVVGGI